MAHDESTKDAGRPAGSTKRQTQSSIAILMTFFNRRETTLRCLQSINSADIPEGFRIEIIAVDDGSTDGTSTAVNAAFRHVLILQGNGTLYWNRGMHVAFAAAMKHGFAFYLWVNDDVVFEKEFLAKLIQTHNKCASGGEGAAIVVGATRDPQGGGCSYGAWRLAGGINPLRLEAVEPGTEPRQCSTFNGNCVLVSAAAAALLGNLDPRFEHGMGDTDYGLRATAAGVKIWLAPGYVGYCRKNPIVGSFRDTALPAIERWRRLLGRKGLPVRSWFLIARKHGGALWPVLAVWPYFKFWVSLLQGRNASGSARPCSGR